MAGAGSVKSGGSLSIYAMACFVGICGRDMHDAEPSDITLDHFLPRCKGGSNDTANLFTACKSDNSGRGARPVKQYATPAAYARIQQNRRRKLGKYLELAKALIKGETGDLEG